MREVSTMVCFCDWGRYVVGDYLWWTDQGSGGGGGSVLAVDNVHCKVTVAMVGVRLYMLDRAVLFDDFVGS